MLGGKQVEPGQDSGKDERALVQGGPRPVGEGWVGLGLLPSKHHWLSQVHALIIQKISVQKLNKSVKTVSLFQTFFTVQIRLSLGILGWSVDRLVVTMHENLLITLRQTYDTCPPPLADSLRLPRHPRRPPGTHWISPLAPWDPIDILRVPWCPP